MKPAELALELSVSPLKRHRIAALDTPVQPGVDLMAASALYNPSTLSPRQRITC
jgi:hypothetical protein